MKLNNTYYMVRHGQALSNTRDVMSCWPETFENPLTEAGVGMARAAAEKFTDKKIDVIFASDVLRAKQTAEIISKATGAAVIHDARLREIDFGTFNGKNIKELEDLTDLRLRGFTDGIEGLKKWIKPGGQIHGYRMAGGEDYQDVQDRVCDFLQDVDAKYLGKTIAIVSHQSPLCLLEEKVKGIELMKIGKVIPGYQQQRTGEVRELTQEVSVVAHEEILNPNA